MKCLLFFALCVSLIACKKNTDSPSPDSYSVKFTVTGDNLAMVDISGIDSTISKKFNARGHNNWDTTIQVKKGKYIRLSAWPYNNQFVACAIDYTPGNGHAWNQIYADYSKPVEVQITLPK